MNTNEMVVSVIENSEFQFFLSWYRGFSAIDKKNYGGFPATQQDMKDIYDSVKAVKDPEVKLQIWTELNPFTAVKRETKQSYVSSGLVEEVKEKAPEKPKSVPKTQHDKVASALDLAFTVGDWKANHSKICVDNGIDPHRWDHLNKGQQRMNLGNVLRARDKKGEAIVI